MSESKSVIETAVQEDYFALRQLKKGAVGWLLLVGLGVAYVISGDFAGWNFGLAQGGGRHVYCDHCGGIHVSVYVSGHVRNVDHAADCGWGLQFCPDCF